MYSQGGGGGRGYSDILLYTWAWPISWGLKTMNFDICIDLQKYGYRVGYEVYVDNFFISFFFFGGDGHHLTGLFFGSSINPLWYFVKPMYILVCAKTSSIFWLYLIFCRGKR